MGKNCDIGPEKKEQIRVLLEETTLTQKEIARKLNVSPQFVSVCRKKLARGETLLPRRLSACGRKPLSSARDDRILVNMCLQNRKASLQHLQQEWSKRGVAASMRTVRRRLFRAGLKACHPLKKPLLTEAMKKERLSWANKYSPWTAEDWAKVVFSDECTMQILDDHAQLVNRYPGEEFNKDCVVQTGKHPRSVILWGAISVHGLSQLHIVEGTMRQDQYRKILETQLFPQIEAWYSETLKKDFLFQQHNAPYYTATKIKNFLAKKQVKLLDWPGSSADMNPIENVWKMLKDKMHDYTVTNEQQLIERLIQGWFHNENIKKCARNMIEGMPDRIMAVIKAHGGWTEY